MKSRKNNLKPGKKHGKTQGSPRHSSGAGLGRGKGYRRHLRPVSPREHDGGPSKAHAPRVVVFLKSGAVLEFASGDAHSIQCRAYNLAKNFPLPIASRAKTRLRIEGLIKSAQEIAVNCPACRDEGRGEI